jgi:PAS domain S-box-containing protein
MKVETINVLLVEDNPGDVALMSLMLMEESGGRISIETASLLGDAAARLDRGGIDVVLLDLSLPDAQGIESVIRLQPHASHVPIIVQTGFDDEDMAVKAMQRGAQDYIVKGKADGRLLVRTIRYAIERTRTARELSEQRRRLDALLENVPDRIYFKDRAGAFIQVNPALAQLYGYSDPSQVVGKTDADLFTPEHANQARTDEEEVFRTGKPIIGKMERETFPDGRTTWALTTKMPLRDETGAIVGTFGISRDITDLKSTEIALRGSEERYGRLLDSVTDYVYTVVLDNGRAVSTQHGPGCLAVTGYSPEEFKADNYLWHRIIFAEDRDAVVSSVTKAAKDGAPFQVEHRIVRKDGAIRWVRNKHVPRRSASGQILAYDGLMSDITEKKRADEELKSAQSQLMQLEKLHSIGQLAAGVAHEVKNPLQVILVGLQYLGDSPLAASDETRSAIREMVEAVRRADGVVQDLLGFSSPRELGMQSRSINELLEQAIRFVRHDLKTAKIKTVLQLAPDLPDALVDPNKIEQVFVNLLTNACHAMPGGGTLTVTTRRKTIVPAEAAPHDAGDRSGSRLRMGERVVVIEIRDTGSGVPPEKLGKIFEPFFTTKSTGKGTGLGLSVTQKILDLHHGKISIENHPEGGVIATVTLKAIKPADSSTQERT